MTEIKFNTNLMEGRGVYESNLRLFKEIDYFLHFVHYFLEFVDQESNHTWKALSQGLAHCLYSVNVIKTNVIKASC